MGVLAVEATTVWAAVSAIGVLITAAIYMVLAKYASDQLKQFAEQRQQEYRPYVIAEFNNRSHVGILAFRNIGRSPALNVRFRLDEPWVPSDPNVRALWQSSGAFVTPIPSLAPSAQLRYTLDVMFRRFESEMPMTVRGGVSYDGADHNHYDEPFVVDLNSYGHALLNDKGTHDLVEQVEQMRKLLEKRSE